MDACRNETSLVEYYLAVMKSINKPGAEERLLEIYRNTNNPSLKAEAALAFKKLSLEHSNFFMSEFEKTGEIEIKIGIIYLLTKYGRAETITFLQRAKQREHSSLIKELCVKGIHELHSRFDENDLNGILSISEIPSGKGDLSL